MADNISFKQKRFVQEYLKDANGTQAAIRAGYSEKTANEQAARLLAKASVKAYLKKLQRAREKRVEISVDKVLQGFASIAYEKSNALKDRLRAYENLGKHLGIYTPDIVQIQGTGEDNEIVIRFEAPNK